jgi:hypothetical protein
MYGARFLMYRTKAVGLAVCFMFNSIHGNYQLTPALDWMTFLQTSHANSFE